MKLIVKGDARSPISEAYRMLRTNIQFTTLDSKENILVITSAGMQEGKSTTVANLAYAFAENDKKVLIIDCDMRRPMIHKVFSISNMIGLSNYLIGQSELAEVISPIETNLHVLPSGTIPPNPSELLGSQRMKDFLEKIRQEYDYVLIDTPPVLLVTDAQILSTLSNGVIMVAASKKTQREAVKKAKVRIESVGGKILGVVLTCVERKTGSGYYYEYTTEKREKRKGLGAIFRPRYDA